MARSNDNNLLVIPFATGQDQGSDEWLSETGKLYSVKNMRIRGSVLQKRWGTAANTGDTTVSAQHGLHAVNDANAFVELPTLVSRVGDAPIVGNTSGDIFAFDRIASAFAFQGACSTCLPVRKRYGLTGEDLSSSGVAFGQSPPAVAVNSAHYLLVAACTNAGVMHAYIESPDGVRIFYHKESTATKVQALAVGATLYLIWQNGTDIRALSLTVTSGAVTLGTETSIATLTGASAHWDTSSYDSTNWFLIHQSGAATVTISKMTGVSAGPPTTFAVTGTVPLSIWARSDSSRVWVGFHDDPSVTGTVSYRIYNASTMASVLGATTIATSTEYGPPLFGQYRHSTTRVADTASAFGVFRQVEATGSLRRATRAFTADSIGQVGAVDAHWHTLPISKPDAYHRVWCMTDSGASNFTTQRAALLRFSVVGQDSPPIIELTGPNMSAMGVTYGPSATVSFFHAQARKVGTSGYSTPSSFYALPFVLTTVNGVPLAKVEVYEFTTGDQEPHKDCQRFGQSTAIAGSPVEIWAQSMGQFDLDGAGGATTGGASEIGFLHAPPLISASGVNPGSGLAAGTYSYRVVYQWADMYGRRHRSAPSEPVSVTLTETSQVAITAGTLQVSQRQNRAARLYASILVYRTVAGGDEHHRVPGYMVGFDNTDGQAGFTDTYADDVVQDEEFLYTEGGVKQNDLAPSCRFTCRSEERLWAGGLWDPRIIQCSKIFIPEEPIQFTDHISHQVVLPRDCTGLAYMDGQVVAFASDAIYMVAGAGPNDQGIGEFSPPRVLSDDVGCIDYRSIVETKVGVFFQSKQGIHMIPRGFGSPVFVGKAVQEDAADSPQCFGADVHNGADYHLVRFLMGAAGATGGSVVLTYDLDHGYWSKDELSELQGEIGVWPDGFAFVSNNLAFANQRPVWYEDGGVSVSEASDLGADVHITQYLKTARIHPFGPGGWGHVNVVAVAVRGVGASQTVTLRVQTDLNSAQSATWTITNTNAVEYREMILATPKCTSVQIELFDGSSGSPSAGVKFLHALLELQPSGGRRLAVPSTERA